MTFIEQLAQTIGNRRDELLAEIRKLEVAEKALANGNAPSTPAPAPRRPRGRSKTEKRDVLLAVQLERILQDSTDGLSTGALAEQGNAEASQVLALLRELERTGQVRRVGVRRGTRWHLITDEDRIAERAAELASRSKRQARV